MRCVYLGDQNSIETNHKDTADDVPSASTTPDDVTVDDVPVDENLFTDDLDGLEAELEELDMWHRLSYISSIQLFRSWPLTSPVHDLRLLQCTKPNARMT